MTVRDIVSPTREALDPILTEGSRLNGDAVPKNGASAPGGRWIARILPFLIPGASGLALLFSFAAERLWRMSGLSGGLTVFALMVAGIPAVQAAWKKVRILRIDIDLLMLLGAGLAVYAGSPFEGALLLFLFALSGSMERFTLGRTQSAIRDLHELTPKEAVVLDGAKPRRLPLEQVPLGARVLVKPGEKVPVDGIVVEGRSSVDESVVTGESIPRDCAVGDTVLAGTQNLDGRLEVRVTKLAADSTVARIVEFVTAARKNPARTQRLIDRIGPTYSVCVIVGAVVLGFLASMIFDLGAKEAVRRGIAILIVASPCALIIATPVAYLAAIAAAARNGVLIKGGAHLEVVARCKVIGFDKTGTLTTGRIRLTDVVTFGGLAEDDALRCAAALETSSTHPLAQAVERAVKERNLAPARIDDFHSKPGEGVSGVVENHAVWIGKPESLPNSPAQIVDPIASLRKEGKTVSVLKIDDCVALLAFQDEVRPQAESCVARLRRQGVHRMHMLTGDHPVVAERVADALQLSGFDAELTPEQKVEAVKRLRRAHGQIIVVGDGVNDAPALAEAGVGIAMGARGVDVALEAADIVLMNDRLDALAWLHSLALRTAKIVRQNVTLALAVISVLGVFAFFGEIPLPVAVVGHEGSTVVVALNAIRLLVTKPGNE